jgi:hypothetical protein
MRGRSDRAGDRGEPLADIVGVMPRDQPIVKMGDPFAESRI